VKSIDRNGGRKEQENKKWGRQERRSKQWIGREGGWKKKEEGENGEGGLGEGRRVTKRCRQERRAGEFVRLHRDADVNGLDETRHEHLVRVCVCVCVCVGV